MKTTLYICVLLMVLAACGEKENAYEQKNRELERRLKISDSLRIISDAKWAAAQELLKRKANERPVVQHHYVDRSADQLTRELAAAADSIRTRRLREAISQGRQ